MRFDGSAARHCGRGLHHHFAHDELARSCLAAPWSNLRLSRSSIGMFSSRRGLGNVMALAWFQRVEHGLYGAQVTSSRTSDRPGDWRFTTFGPGGDFTAVIRQ